MSAYERNSSRIGHKPLAAFMACLAVALLFIATADARNHAGMDRELANAIVFSRGDLPTNMYLASNYLPDRVLRRCVKRTGFAFTAWAGSPTYAVPQGLEGTGVSSVATVLKTTSTARRYYRFATNTLHHCPLLVSFVFPPGVIKATARRPRRLSFPRYAAQSTAWRLPVADDEGDSWTFDFAVVREHRVVLVDDFFFRAGSLARTIQEEILGTTFALLERRAISRQLARSNGNQNGDIAWGDLTGALRVINPYSHRLKRLVRCSACTVSSPTWSPDGRRLAFFRGNYHSLGEKALYVVPSDGGPAKRLAACGDCGSNYGQGRIAWSPNGRQIAFSRREVAGIQDSLWVVSTSGGKLRRLTQCGAGCDDEDPVWSPYGGLLAFSRLGRLYTIRPDGSDLTSIADGADPQWSPNGRRIAFDTRGANLDSIAVAYPDGSHVHILLSGPQGRGPRLPSWSPNGSQLAFLSASGVWTMRPDSSRQKRLYRSRRGVAAMPVWSPDGTTIAFSAHSAGTFLINSNATGLRRLSRVAFSDLSWQPLLK